MTPKKKKTEKNLQQIGTCPCTLTFFLSVPPCIFSLWPVCVWVRVWGVCGCSHNMLLNEVTKVNEVYITYCAGKHWREREGNHDVAAYMWDQTLICIGKWRFFFFWESKWHSKPCMVRRDWGVTSVKPMFSPILSSPLNQFFFGLSQCKKAASPLR